MMPSRNTNNKLRQTGDRRAMFHSTQLRQNQKLNHSHSHQLNMQKDL